MQVTYLSHNLQKQATAPARQSTEKVVDGYALQQSFFWIIRTGILVIVGLGFWYLTLLNALATRGFELEELKAQQAKIHKQMEMVDIEMTIPSSIYALQSSEQVQEMAGVEKVRYFSPRDGAVALR